MSNELPSSVLSLLFAQKSVQLSSCRNFSSTINILHVFIVKLYVTLNLKLKHKASLAGRLLEDIDFTAYLYLRIKPMQNLAVGWGIVAGQAIDLCFVLILMFLRSVWPT